MNRSAQIRGGGVALLLAVASSLLLGAAAPERGVRLDYDVRYGLLPVMSIQTTTAVDGNRYRASSEMRTVGAVRLLFPWSTSSEANGARAGDELHPERFRTVGEYRGVRRLAEVAYGADGTPRAHSDPPAEADDRDAVDAAMQARTIDPLTATLTALAKGCQGTLRVFDGRRRYDIGLTDLGTVPSLPSSRPIYAGPARRCRGTVTPLAGFWRSSERRAEQPSQLDYWIAPPRPGLMPVPVYVELSAPAGTLAISLTAAEPIADAQP